MEAVKVKKISSKLLCGNVRNCDDGLLYSVIGNAVGIKTGTSNYGDWICFKGDFRAWNDKHVVESNQIFLPEILSIPLEVVLKEKQAVSFGVEVMKISTDSSIGYEYQVKNIIPVKESNMLEDMRQKFDACKDKAESETDKPGKSDTKQKPKK